MIFSRALCNILAKRFGYLQYHRWKLQDQINNYHVQGGSEKTDTPVIYTPHKSFFCRFFEIFSKQPTTWYKYKTLVSWISGLYHSLTSKAAKMSINTAISEKVIKLYEGHFFAIKISFLSFKRVVNWYFIKEIHIEQILTAKDWYFNLR